MKKLLLAVILITGFTGGLAMAYTQCGVPPIADVGCYTVCMCDDDGCEFIQICG